MARTIAEAHELARTDGLPEFDNPQQQAQATAQIAASRSQNWTDGNRRAYRKSPPISRTKETLKHRHRNVCWKKREEDPAR